MPKTIPTSHRPAARTTARKAIQPAAKAPTTARSAAAIATNFQQAFHADAMECVRIVKLGVPATVVDVLAKRMVMSKEKLVAILGLARATVDRKARENKPLSADESSKVLGMARLLGQVQAMVEESGDPKGFNAAEWVARWLERPLPALGGQRPAELMDTPEGQRLVSQLVARMQSGAYS
ncbi:MbcA/ParS/Xre antitoxin family protein [Verminephrobacter aporrectodeae]|nr:MbcA/ParS/Xre antitoxin family protein [Verminephrobacter aporrectodeae]